MSDLDVTAELGAPLCLPDSVELGPLAGRGKRSMTFRATWTGNPVALKVYRRPFVEKYRERYGLEIARWEYERNLAFWSVAALRPFSARPYGVLGGADGHSPALIQEFVEGIALKELAAREGRVPPETLEAGRKIVEAASAAGLFDLDIGTRNILVRNTPAGWMPVVHDFNLVPQYLHPPNFLVGLAYRSGLRHKSHRDHRAIRNWARLARG
jgi:hypothetical protein